MQTVPMNALLTVEEAAEYLRVPKSWVYQRTRTRTMPIRKLGRHIRIPRSELLAWVEEAKEMNEGFVPMSETSSGE